MTRATLPVRQRITLAVATLVAAALTVTGLTVHWVESRRITAEIDAGVIAEFEGFRTTDASVSVDTRLEHFLESNVPTAGQVIWSFPTQGSARFVGEAPADLRDDPAFPRRVRALGRTGGIEDFSTATHTYRLGVLPILAGDDAAALVVTTDVAAARAELRSLMITYALLAALSIVVVAGVAHLVAARALRPLRELRDTAVRVTEGDLAERIEVTGTDDLADLQRTVNSMLDRLDLAMRTQRTMLDDAAHELRTPLTVISGHLEVLDPGDPRDVTATRDLVLDETGRMSRLVTDLLVLAKAERPDFLRPADHRVDELLGEIAEKARILGDRDWVLEPGPASTVTLDRDRITQAVLQLVQNAVNHTGPGDRIEIGASLTPSTPTPSTLSPCALDLWVRDSGPGVSEADAERLFERFAQVRPTDTGFGLGLNIVRAIAEAHGGTASVDPPDPARPGACFRLHLPKGSVT